jgi:CubicO group peptidase (beta-lactamase class C family)
VTGLAVARLLELSGDMRLGRKLAPKTSVSELLPSSFPAGDPRRRKIRLGHLMSMTSGLEPDDSPTVRTTGRSGCSIGRSSPSPGRNGPIARPPSTSSPSPCRTSPVDRCPTSSTSRSAPGSAWHRRAGVATTGSIAPAAEPPCPPATSLGWLLLAEGRRATAGREERILSAKIVKLLTRPSPLARKARFAPTPNSLFPVEPDAPLVYGMLWWTNATGTMLGPTVPTDAFYAHDFRESLLVVVPSLELVVVRGGSRPPVLPAFRRELMARVLAAIV